MFLRGFSTLMKLKNIWVAWQSASLWVDARHNAQNDNFTASLEKINNVEKLRPLSVEYELLRACNLFNLNQDDACIKSLLTASVLLEKDSKIDIDDRGYLECYIKGFVGLIEKYCGVTLSIKTRCSDFSKRNVDLDLIPTFPLDNL